jgi:hypothetical protein
VDVKDRAVIKNSKYKIKMPVGCITGIFIWREAIASSFFLLAPHLLLQ